jgi:hypothetical protein
MKGRGDGVTAKGPDSRRVGSTTPKMQDAYSVCAFSGTWSPGSALGTRYPALGIGKPRTGHRTQYLASGTRYRIVLLPYCRTARMAVKAALPTG